MVRRLDRYVFAAFIKIFLVAAAGFPVLMTIVDLAQNIDKYLDLQVPARDIALSYVYWIPESLFMALPAAVLFATVFSIGALTRYNEITAAKASGIGFRRVIAPVLFGAVLATGLDLVFARVMSETSQYRRVLLRQDKVLMGTNRASFVFAGDYGRVYLIDEMLGRSGLIRGLRIERQGSGPAYPSYTMSVDSASFDVKHGGWALGRGVMHLFAGEGTVVTVSFASARDKLLTERPGELMSVPRDPELLAYGELTRLIDATEKSGGDANALRVERALKLAVPATCVIIALFGAPLATSTQRGGSAYGVAVSLATTIVFLVLVQLTKAIGGKGVIPADLAAWLPCLAFGGAGVVLFARTRT
jgi:lipopolysaccharide export system permease protein